MYTHSTTDQISTALTVETFTTKNIAFYDLHNKAKFVTIITVRWPLANITHAKKLACGQHVCEFLPNGKLNDNSSENIFAYTVETG